LTFINALGGIHRASQVGDSKFRETNYGSIKAVLSVAEQAIEPI
jgi:hypothetical protein